MASPTEVFESLAALSETDRELLLTAHKCKMTVERVKEIRAASDERRAKAQAIYDAERDALEPLDADAIVRGVAAIEDGTLTRSYQCFVCGGRIIDFIEFRHRVDCPIVRARSWVANYPKDGA